jgi:hypothetical protein
MGLQEKTNFWLECDGEKCCAQFGEYDDYDDDSELVKEAELQGWIRVEQDGKSHWPKQYCRKCAPKYKPEEEIKPPWISWLDPPEPKTDHFAMQWWEC